MKSSCNKEDTALKYASFSNSGTSKCTKTSVGANQYGQPWQQQKKNVNSAREEVSTDKPGKVTLQTVNNSDLNHSIKPCQFTVFSAVKRKLEFNKNHPTNKKAYEPGESKEQVPDGTMDFIKPLKVPDLKISPKSDFSSRESLLTNEEFSKKIEAAQRDEMALKVNDRVSRKLEFSSSSSTSLFNYENIEPLKVPDFIVSKKKDFSRDNSREKENRTKRVKKDDPQDLSKWAKSQKHISRKEIDESTVSRKFKNDRIMAQGPKNTDAVSKLKPKPKTLTTSTARKDDEKRYKLSNIPLSKSKNKTLDSRNSTSSSESLHPLDKGTRLHDKILIREGYKAMISEITGRKHKDDSQLGNTLKPLDEQKYKSHSESRLPKHQSKSNPVKSVDSLTRDQAKRISDKQKSLKSDSKHSSEISEDLTTAITSTASLSKSQNLATETSSSSTLKSKDFRKSQSASSRNVEDLQYSDDFQTSSDPISNNSMIETKISQESSLSEKLMDPMRISFRDNSYSNLPEFVDLVTPDINLTLRSSKRRKAPIGRENDSDEKDSKQSSLKTIQDNEQSQLGMQRQSNLSDSFSESLQLAMETDRSRLSSSDPKRYTASLLNDNKDSDSKKADFTSIETSSESKKIIQKPAVKVAEVQTQTVNDIATQTETLFCQGDVGTLLAYSKTNANPNEVSGISLDEYEYGADRIENISVPNRMRTTSEISMYETTSSIKTETGTEISISTRDVTCSFNKYLELEMARLIKDERQRYDKMEMLFKSREKTLNDRTKKLIKLEEEKRALRDTGQDSRISSVKKKQRALLLKLQQEKDEMNRLKELHKIASQERKLLLQKQRDMFNPEMSTKSILNKLKRSVDSQSPRRLSGPMKGYDIRSNSSISSLVDSDKSQLDRSQVDLKLSLSDISAEKNEQACSRLEADSALKQEIHCPDNTIDKKLSKIDTGKQQKDAASVKLKYDIKARKFEEKMPKSDKMKQYDLDLVLRHNVNLSEDDGDKSISENIKSESDAIIEEFAQVLKTQFPDVDSESLNVLEAPETIEAFKKMQRISPSSSKTDKETVKKSQQHEYGVSEKNVKRKGLKSQKFKSSQSESNSKSEDVNNVDEVFRHGNKRLKVDSDQLSDDNYQNSMLEELDFNESQSSLQALLKHSNLLQERNQQILRDINDERNNAAAENSESPLSQKDEEENVLLENTSAKSQLSLTISHQSSNDSDRSYSRSVVIRSQQDHHHHTTGLKNSKKLEQILKAREATLVSRRNCVEEWIAWHARLREEENRVARMEQAAYKLVSATTKALSHNDTTVSSDTSDVEGRIEQLSKKLYDRRVEMARLKKEARKQAKQRLRALEANLLNQIKRYDATIRDMRKKLDGKKLAVDTKSVIDFKVPELPLKKIQEIYKNSDLLRSKSDSDILSSRSHNETKDDTEKLDEPDKASAKSKSSAEPSFAPTVYPFTDELENESSEKSDASAVQSYKTKSNSEEVATQKSVITEREVQDMKRSSSQSSNISEEISSEAYSMKSQSEHVPTAKISGSSPSSQDVSEKIEYSASAVASRKDTKRDSNLEEDLPLESEDTSSLFSKKLDHLQLHNKELNDDIHNLENDLKVLTDMMLSLSSKNSNDKSRSINQSNQISKDTDRSTSRDISEELLASESNVQTNNIDEDLQARVKKILSDVVPETDDLITSIEELDVRAGKVDKLDEVNIATTTEDISTHLASQTGGDEKVFGAQTDTIISEVIVTTIKEDVENVSPSESQHLEHKSSRSSDDIISAQIDNTCHSDFDKISISHIQEGNTDNSDSKKCKVISDQVVSVTFNDKETAEDEIYTTAEDINIETRISTVEEVSLSDPASKVEEKEISESAVRTDLEVERKEEIKPFTAEEISTSRVAKVQEKENIYNEDEHNEDKASIPDEVLLETDDSMNKTAESDNDWVLSDSFDIQQFENKDSKTADSQLEESIAPKTNKTERQNRISDIDDSTMFLPRGESTNLQDSFVLKLDETGEEIGIRSKEFNDILDIIEKTKIDEDPNVVPPAPAILELESQPLSKAAEKVESPIERDLSVKSKTEDDVSESIEEEIEGKNDASGSDELVSDKSLINDCENLPQIEIGIKIQMFDDEDEKSREELKTSSPLKPDEGQLENSGAKELGTDDRGSSDGEQLDNLVEVAESKNDTIEKPCSTEEKAVETEEKITSTETANKHVTVILNRTFEIIRDPEYEDISEESLEVSEIFDRSERAKRKSKKFSKIPEKYVIKAESDEVLRILDDLSNKPSGNFKEQNRDSSFEDKSDDLKAVSAEASLEKEVFVSPEKSLGDNKNESKAKVNSLVENREEEAKRAEFAGDGEEAQQQQEILKNANELSQSDGMDTPSGISEIEMDSPKGAHESSRLDIEGLDDDLLSGNSLLMQNQDNDAKTEFHTRPMGISSEKDIIAMIQKLQASLEQPGIEYATIEAKLLQIEHLKIELKIKKLEAVEVSYYFREIPNKPPPPYTPPGAVRLSSSFNESPSPPPSVVPTNVEELVLITDKITGFIYEAKQSGEHIPSLEAPSEICELGRADGYESSEPLRKDRRIFNLFLFDLCKELVADMYQAEYEEPLPSWMRISAKSKPSPRTARSLEELSEYVSKEVATLLGFKTKPQRENLLMRWSRKRRDRVDELLAKETQQEEKEWTNFDFDGLTIKNELTAAVLNNLIAETTKCVKAAYTKKRRLAEASEIMAAQAQTAR